RWRVVRGVFEVKRFRISSQRTQSADTEITEKCICDLCAILGFMKSPSIAIVGAGALGCYYGARLALAGAEVRFLMRSDLAHVRAHGLTLRERDATRHLERVAAF